MFMIALLSSLLVGQRCSGSSCSLQAAPSYSPSYSSPVQPEVFQVPAVQIQPYRTVVTRKTTFKGLTFNVRGVLDSWANDFTWDWSDSFNVKSYRAAYARRNPLKVAAKPERRPTAKPEPLEEPKAGAVAADPFPGGVIAEKLGRRTAYTAPSEEAKRFVEEAKATAGSGGKMHVTVIGSDDARAPVVNDLNTHPAFADLKADLMVQDYKPDEWPVDPSLGFQTQGKPSIIVQAAKGQNDPRGGRVVYRALDYSMGPVVLAEAIRKADPNYKPSADPGPATGNGTAKCPLGFTKDHWPLIGVVSIGLVLILKLPRKDG